MNKNNPENIVSYNKSHYNSINYISLTIIFCISILFLTISSFIIRIVENNIPEKFSFFYKRIKSIEPFFPQHLVIFEDVLDLLSNTYKIREIMLFESIILLSYLIIIICIINFLFSTIFSYVKIKRIFKIIQYNPIIRIEFIVLVFSFILFTVSFLTSINFLVEPHQNFIDPNGMIKNSMFIELLELLCFINSSFYFLFLTINVGFPFFQLRSISNVNRPLGERSARAPCD